MHIILPTIDVLDIISDSHSDSLEKHIQLVMNLMEPGSILRLTQHASLPDAMLRLLISEIHRELYEIVPIYYMLHYPQDGKGKTYHKGKKSQMSNKKRKHS